MEDENMSLNIILITYRDRDNIAYIPAEETFAKNCFGSFGLKFKVIEYDYTDNTSFFGRLPVLYFNGNIIIQRNIPGFLVSLMDCESSDFLIYFENLLYLLRDELRLKNEYFLLKEREKGNKRQGFIERIKSVFYKASQIDTLAEVIICNRDGVIATHFEDNKFEELKLKILQKIQMFDSKFNIDNEYQRYLKDLLIYSYLLENKSHFPEEKLTDNILIISEASVTKAIKLPLRKEIETVILKFRMKFSTKSKERKFLLQEQQITNNFYHTLISFFIFVSFTGVVWYLTKRKKQLNNK
jgi:hypothetical protein